MPTSQEQIQKLQKKINAYRVLQGLGEDHAADIKTLEAEVHRLSQPGGGQFTGPDGKIGSNETTISIGGSVSGANIVVGNNNFVSNNVSVQNILAPVYKAIDASSRPAQDKEDLKADVKEIETAVAQNKPVDETWLARRLRNLKKIAPDIAEVALASLAGPAAAVAVIVKQVADKVKAEG